jgi:hypothetical protein
VLFVCGAVVASTFAVATPGHAAVAEVRDRTPTGAPTGAVVQFTADPGETNDLHVLREARAIRLVDEGAEVVAGSGCTQVTSHEVSCPVHELRISVGDMDDAVSSGAAASIHGDDGNDRVEASGGSVLGGAGADVVEGSGAMENLAGGTGPDTLRGLGGDDFLQDRGDGNLDEFDGGGGRDKLWYDTNPISALTFDLSAPTPGGAPGDEDVLHSIEDAQVSGETVQITGSDKANEILAFADQDVAVEHNVIIGGRGDDSIRAENDGDRDTVRAGRGDDTLGLSPGQTRYPVADDVRCGPGRDVVHGPNLTTLIPSDCEEVHAGDVDYRLRLPVHGLRAALFSATSRICDLDGCSRFAVTVQRAERGGRPVGAILAHAAGSGRPRLSPRLNRRGRRTLARRGRLLVAVRVSADRVYDYGPGFLTELRYTR